jgi:hypothetical protein
MGRSAKIRHRRKRRERRWLTRQLAWHQSFTGGHVSVRLAAGTYVLMGVDIGTLPGTSVFIENRGPEPVTLTHGRVRWT